MRSFVHPSVQICILVTALILQGCSSFSTFEEGGDDALFHASTPDRPIPAEIAQDLTSLNRDGFRQLQAQYAQKAAQEAAINAVKRDPAFASSPSVAQGTPPTAPMAPLAGASPSPEVQPGTVQVSNQGVQTQQTVLAASEPGAEKVQLSQTPNKSGSTTVATHFHTGSHGKKGTASGGPYVVKRGDTLMKIAFETFGDLERWRELYNSNKAKIGSYNVLRTGMVLNLPDREYVLIERNGSPYLIKHRDTLSKISFSLYGTESKWRSIWHNNEQLIHDPNKIYAGFTLYYEPSGRSEAMTNSTRAPAAVPHVTAPAPAVAAVTAAPVVAPVVSGSAPVAPTAPVAPVAAPTGVAPEAASAAHFEPTSTGSSPAQNQ